MADDPFEVKRRTTREYEEERHRKRLAILRMQAMVERDARRAQVGWVIAIVLFTLALALAATL